VARPETSGTRRLGPQGLGVDRTPAVGAPDRCPCIRGSYSSRVRALAGAARPQTRPSSVILPGPIRPSKGQFGWFHHSPKGLWQLLRESMVHSGPYPDS
jgi:hypothetical protein